MKFGGMNQSKLKSDAVGLVKEIFEGIDAAVTRFNK